ncbi:MAG: metal-binding protein [Hyphomicrobiales bacterium]|nr:MAG: metal-binding protein [Hyphomicrobiales bacterium]
MTRTRTNLLSILFTASRLKHTGDYFKETANADTCNALCEKYKLQNLENYKIEGQIFRWKKGGARITGKITADIVQSCVASLAPVVARIDEDVNVHLVPEGSKLARTDNASQAGGILINDPEGQDIPEVFHDDSIDVGLLFEEYFSLALDPYPRKPGVPAMEHIEHLEDDEEVVDSPFAALAGLKSDSK